MKMKMMRQDEYEPLGLTPKRVALSVRVLAEKPTRRRKKGGGRKSLFTCAERIRIASDAWAGSEQQAEDGWQCSRSTVQRCKREFPK